MAFLKDPETGMFAQIVSRSQGIMGAVSRVDGRLGVIGFSDVLGTVTGPYETIGGVVAALRLALADHAGRCN